AIAISSWSPSRIPGAHYAGLLHRWFSAQTPACSEGLAVHARDDPEPHRGFRALDRCSFLVSSLKLSGRGDQKVHWLKNSLVRSSSRRVFKALCRRDLTVPSGTPLASAISARLSPSTNLKSSVSRCSSGKRPTTIPRSASETRSVSAGAAVRSISKSSPSVDCARCVFCRDAIARFLTAG